MITEVRIMKREGGTSEQNHLCKQILYGSEPANRGYESRCKGGRALDTAPTVVHHAFLKCGADGRDGSVSFRPLDWIQISSFHALGFQKTSHQNSRSAACLPE